MNRKLSASATVYACFAGDIVQAIVNNFAPLLFLTFQSSFGISLEKIALLTTLNFGIQLLVDAASAGFVDRIGYRASIVIAHAMAAVGIAMMALAGDVGCGAGPTFVGTRAGVFGEDLRPAFICAVIFPILMILALVLYKKSVVSK